ncbi:MAG: TIGR01244 family phosphatase [Gammaproteobacteria bacterium]|nr:MAG: TIGR01244 family phosphatase [Gammaproteobacteria bacterium]RLA59421.1 MAG: TIGR01244 family phosphatase [Gammaproteobacteria bacterium]
MKIVKLTESIAVSEQITPENVADIAAAGYQVLVNNRPDGEEACQPASADIAAAAQAAGLEYYYLPITAGNFPGPDFGRMRSLLDDTLRPVLAFCRSGTRCTNLWVASRDDKSMEQARAQARQLGYDLGMSTPRT